MYPKNKKLPTIITIILLLFKIRRRIAHELNLFVYSITYCNEIMKIKF